MPKAVEFFFDFGSPTSYLAWTQLPKLAADAGAQLVWRPMLLGGVFGAPTMFVGEQMFFGQDRLDFVREAPAAATA